jgi:hypothetical protein
LFRRDAVGAPGAKRKPFGSDGAPRPSDLGDWRAQL